MTEQSVALIFDNDICMRLENRYDFLGCRYAFAFDHPSYGLVNYLYCDPFDFGGETMRFEFIRGLRSEDFNGRIAIAEWDSNSSLSRKSELNLLFQAVRFLDGHYLSFYSDYNGFGGG